MARQKAESGAPPGPALSERSRARGEPFQDEGPWRERNRIAHLIGIMRSHERLFAKLRAAAARIGRARVYLASPSCNLALGHAALEHARLKHCGVLVQLRANRIEALQILGESASPRPV